MFVIKYRKISYTISALLVIGAIFAISVYGLHLGIDFTGGSLLEVHYSKNVPSNYDIENTLTDLGYKDVSVRKVGQTDLNKNEMSYLIRLQELTDEERVVVTKGLEALASPMQILRVATIGPILGKEAMIKSLWSIFAVVIAIILFIAFAFRHVAKPVSSWKYGVIAVVALIHDILIPVGVFAVLGHFMGVEADTLFVTALLVIFGFSVHDTIVVFDRVRENLKNTHSKFDFPEIVGKSISQTMARSINTSFTTLLALVAILIWGPVSVYYFTLALIIGIVSGTYSSIFLASPLLVTADKLQSK